MATSARTAVKAIQDIMRKDVGVDGDAQRLSQLCWLFFLKIIDDQDERVSRDSIPGSGEVKGRKDGGDGAAPRRL